MFYKTLVARAYKLRARVPPPPQDYRGPLGIVLINNGVVDFEVAKGDRIAQFLLERVDVPPVEVVDDLDVTARGDKGFGSTGITKLPMPNAEFA